MSLKKLSKAFMLFVMCWNDHGVGIASLSKLVGEVLGGVKGLIDNVLMVAKAAKKHPKPVEPVTPTAEKPVFPEDGGLPPQDSVADESGLLPESDFTRMLRHNGRSPAWFTQRPDHESD